MKLLIASDLHGSAYYCKKLIGRFQAEGADKLILLGDLLYHGPRNPLPAEHDPKAVCAMLNPLSDRILAVRGNCDAEVDQLVLDFPVLADYAVLFLNGKTVYLTHGHKEIPALQKGSLLINGHFHVPACEDRGDYRYLNCGSLALPKDGTPHSYLLYDEGTFLWKDADGNEFLRETI